MSDEKHIPEKIKITYDRTPSYKIFKIDGAHGGFTPKGDLFLDLYKEVTSPPNSEIKKVTRDGKIGETLEVDRNGDIKRIIECAISFDIETAVQIHKWLDEKIKQYKDAVNKSESNLNDLN